MLREPVDQAVSLYYYILRMRHSAEPFYEAAGAPFPGSWEQYLAWPNHFNNQLAFLAGKLHRTAALTGDDLARAKDRLLDLKAHVGLTERYADSLHVFECVTGRCIPDRKVQIQNRTLNRPSLDAIPRTVIDRIREQSALDMELYEFGRALFEEDIRRHGPAPDYSFSEAGAARSGQEKL